MWRAVRRCLRCRCDSPLIFASPPLSLTLAFVRCDDAQAVQRALNEQATCNHENPPAPATNKRKGKGKAAALNEWVLAEYDPSLFRRSRASARPPPAVELKLDPALVGSELSADLSSAALSPNALLDAGAVVIESFAKKQTSTLKWRDSIPPCSHDLRLHADELPATKPQPPPAPTPDYSYTFTQRKPAPAPSASSASAEPASNGWWTRIKHFFSPPPCPPPHSAPFIKPWKFFAPDNHTVAVPVCTSAPPDSEQG